MCHRRSPHSDRHSRCAAAALLLVVASVVCFAHRAHAHGDVHVQIDRITSLIESTPTAELFVKRGDLHRLDENFTAALADLERAEKLNPALDTIFMTRGRTQFEAGRFEQAVQAFNRLLQSKPEHPEGLLFRARSSRARGDHAAALKDYNHLVAVMPSPVPDCFLERAASLVALKRPQDAVRGLDEGTQRLGNLTVLQQCAIQIEVDLKEYESALARIERVMAVLRRKEVWLERRGDILTAAGRQGDAMEAYTAALGAIAVLPEFHRGTQPMLELKARLQTHLGAQAPNAPQPPSTKITTTSP